MVGWIIAQKRRTAIIMQCHFVQHCDFETPGSLTTWALEHQFEVEIYHPYRGDNLPQVKPYEPVIFLGGPQSATQYQQYDYLENEVSFIRELIKLKQPLVGICLGAQLIGESLGGKTVRSPEKEVGIFPITLTKEAQTHPYFVNLDTKIPVMHWHNDMPGLTPNARVLATSEGCPRQIVEFAPHILGFQCHFEAKDEWLALLLKHARCDLAPSRFTQSSEDMRKSSFEHMNHFLHTVLDRWYQQAT